MLQRVSWSWVLLAAVLAAVVARGVGAGGEGEGEATPLDFPGIIQGAKQKVTPAVVFIRCIRVSTEEGKRRSEQISGSGVIITPGGEFLTNWHVVEKAESVRCLLQDGRALKAEVVGSDKDTDLALCRLVQPEGGAAFPYAEMGDSAALREGDFVMAFGAPWSLSRSVSLGILSCTRRYLEGHSEYSLWLQTDASISPGNSGGPLVDITGRVVGINTRAFMYGGDMGFAVPSETIARVVAQLREHKAVRWSWVGLELQPLHDFDRNMYFGGNEGVIVAGTEPESPCRGAGLCAQDRILEIDGQPVTATSVEDLPAIRARLGFLEEGRPARFLVQRGAERLEIDIIPRAKGEVEGKEFDCPRWDFSVKAINQFDNPELYFHRKEGLFVYGVREPGNAGAAGLQRGDILLKVGTSKVTSIEELRTVHGETLARLPAAHKVTISVLRNGLLRQVVLDYARDYERE